MNKYYITIITNIYLTPTLLPQYISRSCHKVPEIYASSPLN